jgi:ABC-type lipoprotein export system ATPase subunit
LPKTKLLELNVALAGDQTGDSSQLSLELNSGHTYQIFSHSLDQRKFLLQYFASLPNTASIPSDGGMISNLTAQENILLPVQYHATMSDQQALQKTASVLARFELDQKDVLHILQSMPSNLSVFEKRLVGFARVMLIEPEILVCDAVFEELTDNEVAIINRFNEVFHLYFPFRTAIFLELDHTRGIIHPDQTFYL